MGAQVFYALAVVLLAASFVANGGWDGRWFASVQNCDAADRLLFLAWAMTAASAAAYLPV